MTAHGPGSRSHLSGKKAGTRKQDLLNSLQEMLGVLDKAEQLAKGDPESARDLSDAAFKIRMVVIRLLSS